jgi:Nuclease-related domain
VSFLDRLTRAFSTLSHVELDDRAKIGALGEQYAAQVIDDSEGNWIRNPIIPHPTKPGYTLEADFLVYTRGNLFCVEIKNYKGRISYAPKYRTVQVEQRDFLVSRYVPQTIIDGYDDSRILQEKVGNYGEAIFTKEYPNPLKKTRYFLHRLKDYLSARDARFQRLHIIPVVGFAEYADISAIHSFETGMIYVSEIPTFFERHAHPKFAKSPSPWILEGLQKVPTWDLVLTTNNEWMNGIIQGSELTFRGTDRRRYALPYMDIHAISLQRTGFFSAYDQMTVQYTNGSTKVFHSVGGEIHLQRVGERQVHQLRNVNRIVVGVANKLA